MMQRLLVAGVMTASVLARTGGAGPPIRPAAPDGPYLTVGLFIAGIEEGARIFTPVRLLPADHPEALGHEFPTVQQFHGGEDRVLVALGREAGLLLSATLQRYPTEPDEAWPYEPFQRPPVTLLASSPVERRGASAAPVPGLRAVAFLSRFPVAFIIDTRGRPDHGGV